MMWYGFIYYLLLFFFIFMLIIYCLTFFSFNSLFKIVIARFVCNIVLSFFIFFTLLNFTMAYQLFNVNSTFFTNKNLLNVLIFENYSTDFFASNAFYSLNLLQVYYFPFIYIFFFVTLLSILFCLSYNINEFNAFMFYCAIILIAGYILFFTDSLLIFFFAYEMLLVPSFFILYKFAKTKRCIEAAYLMFFWTQFGALFLIFSFIYLFFLTDSFSFMNLNTVNFSNFEINFLFICWIIGFGVKLPIWPFYGWLPKAHVEASTNFSIFLSGVLVKFAFFGLLKCLLIVQLEPTFIYIYPILLIGIVDAVFKLFYQIDLKKLVAYSTVVEMHWLTICIISGQSCLMLSGFCMLISHALLSTNSFLLVDAINRRFKTRLITEISGINFLCPKLFLLSFINCLIFLGFPGSIFFIAEFLFFTFFFDLFPLLCLILLVLLYLFGPTFFFRSWINVLFGLSNSINKKIPLDLSTKEFITYFGVIVIMFWLGLTWQIFLF